MFALPHAACPPIAFLALAPLLASLGPSTRAGEVLPIAVELPPGVTVGEAFVSAVLEPRAGALESSRTETGVWRQYARLTAGGAAAAIDAEFSQPFLQERSCRVHLTTRDGLWWGSAVSSPSARAARTPLAIELVACGRVDAEVVLAGERALTEAEERLTLRRASSQVWASFTPLDRPGVVPIRMTSSLNANARFGPLLPGRYRMDVGGQRVRATTREIAIEAGAALPLVLELELERSLFDVDVSITSRDRGDRASFLSVVLRSVEVPERAFRADQGQNCVLFDAVIRTPSVEEPGGCTIPSVPAGAYDVETHGPLGTLVWPVRARIEAAGPPLELVVLDSHEERGYRLEAYAAESGERIDLVWIRPPAPDPLFPLPSAAWPGDLLAPASFASEGSLGGDLEWVVVARGRIPQHGTLDDFLAGERGRTATVALDAGWGTCVNAFTADGTPVAGVSLLGDGRLLGTTDARGHADLAAPSAPSRLEAHHARFDHVGGTLAPELGLLPPVPFAPVTLEMASRASAPNESER